MNYALGIYRMLYSLFLCVLSQNEEPKCTSFINTIHWYEMLS